MPNQLKKILLSLTFINCWICFGQVTDSIKYSAVFIDCCTNEIGNFYLKTDWYVIDENQNRFIPKNDIVTLPENGKYSIISFAYQSESITLNLNGTNQIDTFKTSCLSPHIPEAFYTTESKFVRCTNFIDSIYKEYHVNGNLRWYGNFSNGLVADSLIQFYFSGEIKSKLLIDKKSVRYYDYYSNGQLITDIDSEKRFRTYYHSNGILSMKMSNNGKTKTTVFFENGDLKIKQTNRKEKIYNANGNLVQKLSRKPLSIKDRLKSDFSSINIVNKWLKYDSLGNKTKEVKFTSKNHYSIYTGSIYRLSKEKCSSISYYKNGEKEIRLYPTNYKGENGESISEYHVAEYENGKFKLFKSISYFEFELLFEEYEKE